MDTRTVPLMELHERHARLARIGNKSEKTIAWYRGALEDFCRYLERQMGIAAPARLGDFSLELVRDYILHLRQRPTFIGHPYKEPGPPLSDASVNCYVRGLRGFASWLYEQEYTDANLLGRLKAPKMTQKAVEIVSDEEVTRILDALKAPTATNVRNRAIFLTLLDTGIRASELLTLTIPRAHLDEGYLLVLGKGKKERPVKIGQTAAQAIRLYLTRDRPEPARPTIHEVFLTEGYRVRHVRSGNAKRRWNSCLPSRAGRSRTRRSTISSCASAGDPVSLGCIRTCCATLTPAAICWPTATRSRSRRCWATPR